jgi:hypothetical protein
MLGAMARAAWWGLPWFAALAISASAVYGMAAAVAGGESVAGRTETVTTAVDGPVNSETCDARSAAMLLNAVSNGWIPARFAGYCRGE